MEKIYLSSKRERAHLQLVVLDQLLVIQLILFSLDFKLMQLFQQIKKEDILPSSTLQEESQLKKEFLDFGKDASQQLSEPCL